MDMESRVGGGGGGEGEKFKVTLILAVHNFRQHSFLDNKPHHQQDSTLCKLQFQLL